MESSFQKILIDSTPKGSQVVYNGQVVGYTPLELEIHKGHSYHFDLRHAEFRDSPLEVYGAHRQVLKSKWCKFDYYYGWFFIGIPVFMAKKFAEERCKFLPKDKFYVGLTPVDIPKITFSPT
jgi:hypothetical protein